MGDRPLIVVLLWLPVTALRVSARSLEFLLGRACLAAAICLHFCLLHLMIRTSALPMLLTGAVRGVIVLGAGTAVGYAAWWQLALVLREGISLWISLPTDLLCVLIVTSLTIRGLKGQEIKDFRPYIILTLKDFVSFLLTLVSPTQLLVLSVLFWPRLYQMPKAVLTYHEEAIKAVGLGLIDTLCLAIALPMFLFPWRLKDEWTGLKDIQPWSRISVLSLMLLNTVADFFFIVPLVVVVATVYRLPRLVRALRELPISL